MRSKISSFKNKNVWYTQKKKENKKAGKIDLRPWAELPDDILIAIARILSSNAADFVRFGAVCKSWMQITSPKNYPPACRMPLLMLPEDDPNCRLQRFFSPSEDKIYKFLLPEARDKWCCTSVGGYLVTVGKDLEMHLLHPFSRDRIKLPSFHNLDVSFYHCEDWTSEANKNLLIRKVCLSSSPSQKEKKCIALAFYGSGKELAIAKIGGLRWTSIRCKGWPYEDTIFYKGQFYAVNYRGDVVALDLRRCKAIFIARGPDEEYNSVTYLEESSGDLLQVIRYGRWDWNKGNGTTDTFEYKSYSLRVYKLLESGRWEQLKTLGGRSLFVGHNNSFLVAGQGIARCKGDCIYFTDVNAVIPGGGHDMGIYSMENGSIEPFFTGQSRSPYSPPLWIAPFVWWK